MCDNYSCGKHGDCKVINEKPVCVCDKKKGWFGSKCEYRDLSKFICWDGSLVSPSQKHKCPVRSQIYICSNNKQKAPNNDPSNCSQNVRLGLVYRIGSLWWVFLLCFLGFGFLVARLTRHNRETVDKLDDINKNLRKRLSQADIDKTEYLKTMSTFAHDLLKNPQKSIPLASEFTDLVITEDPLPNKDDDTGLLVRNKDTTPETETVNFVKEKQAKVDSDEFARIGTIDSSDDPRNKTIEIRGPKKSLDKTVPVIQTKKLSIGEGVVRVSPKRPVEPGEDTNQEEAATQKNEKVPSSEKPIKT